MRHPVSVSTIGLVLVFAMSGCQPVDREAQLVDFATTCQVAYGFTVGTDGFSQCMMQLDQNARSDADARRQRLAAAMQSAGDGFNRAAAQNQRVNCTHTPGYGGIVNTSCY
jgi:hypothetical protein